MLLEILSKVSLTRFMSFGKFSPIVILKREVMCCLFFFLIINDLNRLWLSWNARRTVIIPSLISFFEIILLYRKKSEASEVFYFAISCFCKNLNSSFESCRYLRSRFAVKNVENVPARSKTIWVALKVLKYLSNTKSSEYSPWGQNSLLKICNKSDEYLERDRFNFLSVFGTWCNYTLKTIFTFAKI